MSSLWVLYVVEQVVMIWGWRLRALCGRLQRGLEPIRVTLSRFAEAGEKADRAC
jgi:hypothetical protein